MLHRYWDRFRGTLAEEFPAVCAKDDSVRRPLPEQHGIEVELDDARAARWLAVRTIAIPQTRTARVVSVDVVADV
jgi:hypothetical protein